MRNALKSWSPSLMLPVGWKRISGRWGWIGRIESDRDGGLGGYGLRSGLDRPGVRPGGRLTFLSRDKKVSKETRLPRRPFGVPSLRTLSAGGPENSLRSDSRAA